MFNKLSFKIGLLFFIFILTLEVFLFFILYTNLANDRIEEVMLSLLARGNTHRDVLEDHFDESTLEHVGIMESASEFSVIITDEHGEIIISSDQPKTEMMSVINHENNEEVPREGKIVEDRWTESEYVATDSPITIDNEHKGHVFMFAHADYVKKFVEQLTKQFLFAIIITVVLTIATIFILSRFIAHPLIEMKVATEQLSKGDHDVLLSTERKDELGELANSIATLAKDLREMKMARNEFLASVAHELRTPLTYIKGYAEMINRPETTEAEKQHFLEIIREETAHLTVLVKNLFQLAKIDQFNFSINRENVDLCHFLEEMAERIRPALAEKNMKLHVQCSTDLTVSTDPERFQQVVMNILDNANKYVDANTQITIEAFETEAEVVLNFHDVGEGISEADVPYVFARLYRVEKSRSRQTGGSGLGLTITKEIVEAHGGTIKIESEVGRGSTVTIMLPKDDNDDKGTHR